MGDGELGLERRLEQLLEIERFDPPAAFAAAATVNSRDQPDDAVEAWGQRAKQLLDWESEWDTVLDDSRAPFYKWFVGGTLNASYNCLDRHVEAGRGDRVAYHWRGEEGEERDVTYAELLADVQRLANAFKDLGVGRATSSGSTCR